MTTTMQERIDAVEREIESRAGVDTYDDTPALEDALSTLRTLQEPSDLAVRTAARAFFDAQYTAPDGASVDEIAEHAVRAALHAITGEG